jgi:hypothetical protein
MAGAGLFDVLEHLPDDAGSLVGVHRLLAPGGRLYLTVPAYQWLWSPEDELSGHCRRYTLEGLRRVVERAGFQVEFATYFFSFLPLPILAARVVPYRLGLSRRTELKPSEHVKPDSLAVRLLQPVLRREVERLRDGRAVWCGGSCLLVARKPI